MNTHMRLIKWRNQLMDALYRNEGPMRDHCLADLHDLLEVADLAIRREYEEAWEFANNMDTYPREMIPEKIWNLMRRHGS